MARQSFLAAAAFAALAFAAGACSAQSPTPGTPASGGAASDRREVISPMDPPFHCAGDGATDDTACFQAALDAASQKELALGHHAYLITRPLVLKGSVKISGEHAGWTDRASCLVAGARNLNILTVPVTAIGTTLRDFCIDAGHAGANSAGAAITVNAGTNTVKIENLWIARPCIGIDMNGNSNTIGGSLTIITAVAGAGCHGIRVGAQTTRSESTDIRISNTTVQGDQSNPPDEDLLVLDAGGLTLMNNDFLYGRIGTKLAPGPRQQIDWLFASNTVLGDTTEGWSLYITTADRSAQVKGLKFDGSWTASNKSGDLVYIGNDAGGLVTDILFSAHRFYNTPGSTLTIKPNVVNVVVGGASEFCGYGGYGVNLAQGASSVSLVGDRIAPACAGVNGAGRQAVNFGGTNSQINITANDVTGNVGPNFMNGVPTGASQVVNNLPIDQNAPTIPSASTISLAATPSPTWFVTGSAPISSIVGGWQGRTVLLVSATGPLKFAGGGSSNLCNSKTTSGAMDSISAFFTGRCWLLK